MHLSYNARGLRRVTDAAEFGRVAVLLGGSSAERETPGNANGHRPQRSLTPGLPDARRE